MSDFRYIDPPFQFNAPSVAQVAPEVSGNYLLRSMVSRLGWDSISGKRILDFGCGVRFARTIINLGIDVSFYAGVDVNKPAIDWLNDNVDDPRFLFAHLDVYHPMYSRDGPKLVEYPDIPVLANLRFDLACMFSVITHQTPDNARRVFTFLRRLLRRDDPLYFTAFIDDATDGYREGEPTNPTEQSTYNPRFLSTILAESGWAVERTFEMTRFQQPAFVARAR